MRWPGSHWPRQREGYKMKPRENENPAGKEKQPELFAFVHDTMIIQDQMDLFTLPWKDKKPVHGTCSGPTPGQGEKDK